MTDFLRRLPFWAEFAFVVALAFGYFIAASLHVALNPALLAKPHHDTMSLIVLAAMELVLLAILGSFLWVRGWTLAKIGLTPSWNDAAIGLGLGFAFYVVYVVAFMVFAVSFPGLAAQARDVVVVAPGIPPALALIVPPVNALFEESLVAGYVITALRGRIGDAGAINVSVGIRLAYHLYQGALGVVAIVPFGLILAYWYVRSGKLWPLIVAHAAIDLIGLLAVMRG